MIRTHVPPAGAPPRSDGLEQMMESEQADAGSDPFLDLGVVD